MNHSLINELALPQPLLFPYIKSSHLRVLKGTDKREELCFPTTRTPIGCPNCTSPKDQQSLIGHQVGETEVVGYHIVKLALYVFFWGCKIIFFLLSLSLYILPKPILRFLFFIMVWRLIFPIWFGSPRHPKRLFHFLWNNFSQKAWLQFRSLQKFH